MEFFPVEENDCFCPKNEDGECIVCKGDVSHLVQRLIETQIKFQKDSLAIAEKLNEICGGCHTRYLDYAFSNYLQGPLFREAPPKFREPVYSHLIETMEAAGVNKFPLTEKAWREMNQVPGL